MDTRQPRAHFNQIRRLIITAAFISLPLLTACTSHKGFAMPQGTAYSLTSGHSAAVWSRTDRPAWMTVILVPAGPWLSGSVMKQQYVDADSYFSHTLHFDGLKHAYYHAFVFFTGERFEEDDDYPAKYNRFLVKLPPRADEAKAVSFTFSGDLGGQNSCRHSSDGYALFKEAGRQPADFFIGLGDLIYADGICTKRGRYRHDQLPGPPRASELAGFRQHWEYNRSDQSFIDLLKNTSIYAIWDDHEVKNNFDSQLDARTKKTLLADGLKSFREFHPLPPADEAEKMYSSYRWGRHLELIILDLRRYRSPNYRKDSKRKTMLGREQFEWLQSVLKKSTATWQVIVSSVPLSLPTGSFKAGHSRDGWANYRSEYGFERELIEVVRLLHKFKRKNVLFLSTDVHMAMFNQYFPDPAALKSGQLPQDPVFSLKKDEQQAEENEADDKATETDKDDEQEEQKKKTAQAENEEAGPYSRELKKGDLLDPFDITEEVTYEPTPGREKDFSFYEMITGPISAGLFLKLRQDKTFSPDRLFILGNSEKKLKYKDARHFFNFGRIEINRKGVLTAMIINADGEELYNVELKPR